MANSEKILNVKKTWPQIIKSRETKIFVIITILITALDQLTKYLVELYQPTIHFLFLTITYSTNTGAGFGILKESSFILGIVSLIAAITVIYFYPRLPQTTRYAVLAGLFLAGILGNGIDRIFQQYVVDFFSSSFWPSFNVADAAITVAVIGYSVLSIRDERRKKKKVLK